MHKSTLIFLCIAILPLVSCAQFTQIDRTNQQWMQYAVNIRISEQFSVMADGNFRTRSWFQDPALYLVRLGGAYHWHQRWNAAVGFTHSGDFSDSELQRLEYRPHQDLIFQFGFFNVKSENRLRLEERIFRIKQTDQLLPLVVRLRYRFQIAAPILSLSVQHPERVLLLMISNEVLINFGKEIRSNLFDQNRLTLGPGLQLSKNARLGIQYAYHWGNTDKSNVFRQDHVLLVSFRHSFDLRKNSEE